MTLSSQEDFDLNDPLGADLMIGSDLDPAHRMVSGLELYRRDMMHRITTRRGLNIDDPDYGLDVVEELLSAALTPAQLIAIPKRLEAEIRKDPRTDTVQVTLTPTSPPDGWTVLIAGTAGGNQPYRLVVGISDALARILEEG